jgi:hypothetical protein
MQSGSVKAVEDVKIEQKEEEKKSETESKTGSEIKWS